MKHKDSWRDSSDDREGDLSGLQGNLAEIESRLQLAGKRLGDSFSVSEERLSNAVEECLWRLWEQQEAAARSLASVGERLIALQAFIAPMCGPETATRALRAAAQQSAVPSPDLLTENLWPNFLKNLSSITRALCGDPAGTFVSEVGRLAP